VGFLARFWLCADYFLLADHPDTTDGSGWVLRYDHHSAAWLVALPSALNVQEWDTFRVYMKFPFCGISHDLLKTFEQDVAELEFQQCRG
jgi:hypothetical protein